MSAPMTLPDWLKSAPSVTSLAGLSALLVNSLGEPQRASATLSLVRRMNLAGMDLDDMGSEQGITLLVTSNTTLNVPPGRNYGLVLSVTFSEPNVFQVFIPYSTPSGIYTRCKNSGVWKDWSQLV